MNLSQPSQGTYLSFALRIAGDFGVVIALPAIAGGFLGVFIDKKFGTTPWGLIIILLLAFIFTAYIVFKKAIKYGKQYEEINKKL
jgi:F0F1-type ATP synthase assembly protein I